MVMEQTVVQTDVARLRADVNRLGGPRDTVDLRHKVCKQARRSSESDSTLSNLPCTFITLLI